MMGPNGYGENLHWAIANNVALEGEAMGLFPGVEVVLWARNRADTPNVQEIRLKWGVSRATAYRWLAALKVGAAAADPAFPWSTTADSRAVVA